MLHIKYILLPFNFRAQLLLRRQIGQILRHEKPALAVGVAINEAVEIAKAYGTEESPRFINGVLGKLARK